MMEGRKEDVGRKKGRQQRRWIGIKEETELKKKEEGRNEKKKIKKDERWNGNRQ